MRYNVYYSNQVPGSCLVQRVLSPALLPCRRRLSDILVMVVKTDSASLSYVTYCTWHAAYLLQMSFCVAIGVQLWASECPDVKNYKWRLNPVWHRMLYSCTHTATVGVKGLIGYELACQTALHNYTCLSWNDCWWSHVNCELLESRGMHTITMSFCVRCCELFVQTTVRKGFLIWFNLLYLLSIVRDRVSMEYLL